MVRIKVASIQSCMYAGLVLLCLKWSLGRSEKGYKAAGDEESYEVIVPTHTLIKHMQECYGTQTTCTCTLSVQTKMFSSCLNLVKNI